MGRSGRGDGGSTGQIGYRLPAADAATAAWIFELAGQVVREPPQKGAVSSAFLRADARIRTGDPFITSEVLYQLSYVGKRPANPHLTRAQAQAARGAHTAVVLHAASGSDANSGFMRNAV
jgi:hypothetical protein